MLLAVDQVFFRFHDSIGLRLEDLKERPKDTLRALCRWLVVEEAPSLYAMTAQGKKWWGDPSSPDYDETTPMSPFGSTATKRPVGTIFSKKDQFILQTLFYPFSTRFGYRRADPCQFEKDLKAIRPLLDDVLDFERTMLESSLVDPARFKQSVAYLTLRACFTERWEVLNESKTYPYMLPPLSLSREQTR